jgi:hypothetical protein
MINRAKPGLLPIAAVVLLALATDAQANQASTAPTADRPAMESSEARGGDRPEAATQPAPVTPAPGTAPAISSSVQESRLQAMTRRNPSGDGTDNGGVAESTATSQGIWQIQISSCKAHCRGVSQVQTAKQHNRTVQTFRDSRHLTGAGRQLLKGDRPETNSGLNPSDSGATPTSQGNTGLVPVSNTRTGPVPVAGSDLTESSKPGLTQIQLGCLSHCFGTTTRTSPLPLQAHGQTLQQLLDTITRALPSLQDVPAAEQNTVVQTSHQWQYGSGLGPGQTQTTTQLSSTVQSHDVPLTGAARAALGDYVPQLVNQTEQGIWQLQIGCLAFCSQTRQVQRAEQSNTTMRSAATSSDASARPPTSSVNITTQTIWQVQLGCLMWCFDTEQRQTASSENAEGEQPGQEATAGTPPPARTPPPVDTPPPAGASPPARTPPSAGTPPPAGPPPPASSVRRDPCDRSPTPRECNPMATLGGVGPQATGDTAGPSSRPARRARRGGLIVTARSGWISVAGSSYTVTGRALGAGAGAAIYRPRVARAPVTAPRKVMDPGPSSSGHEPGARVSRSVAAGMSSGAANGPDAPVIALVAAIALCTLAAALAFRSEPIPRRRADEK